MIMTVPKSPPIRTSMTAPPPTPNTGISTWRQSPSMPRFFSRIMPSQMTRATLIISDGWNWIGPRASQLRLPATSIPRGVNTTRHCRKQATSRDGQAMRAQNAGGIRLATSMSGTPMSAKKPWRRSPPKKPASAR